MVYEICTTKLSNYIIFSLLVQNPGNSKSPILINNSLD